MFKKIGDIITAVDRAMAHLALWAIATGLCFGIVYAWVQIIKWCWNH